jgi:hypothetical protein
MLWVFRGFSANNLGENRQYNNVLTRKVLNKRKFNKPLVMLENPQFQILDLENLTQETTDDSRYPTQIICK